VQHLEKVECVSAHVLEHVTTSFLHLHDSYFLRLLFIISFPSFLPCSIFSFACVRRSLRRSRLETTPSPTDMAISPMGRQCSGADCSNTVGSLQCPTCLKLSIEGSYFCSQDCFKKNWVSYGVILEDIDEPALCTIRKAINKLLTPLRPNTKLSTGRKVSFPIVPRRPSNSRDKGTGYYNPFPKFRFTGSLRPVYPLSPRRSVPKSIPAPEWWQDGIPKYPPSMRRRNKIDILDAKAQQSMRKVCRLTREVLDIAAAAVRPGITTDRLDEIVHTACIERKVCQLPAFGEFLPSWLT